jgi:2-haloalkanoic acid dehalogenase type II
MVIKLVIFDLWETLIPATIDFDKLKELLKKSNIDRKDLIPRYERAVQLKEYEDFADLKRDFFNEFKEEDNDLLEEELKEIFIDRYEKITFYNDVIPTLRVLKDKNYKLALLSNTENFVASHLEENLGAKNYFDFFAYSYKIGYIKPDREAFLTVINHFNVKPEEALMVGDSLRSDINGAKKVGINTCYINRGKAAFDKFTIDPDFEVHTLKDIPKIIEGL